MGKKSSLLYEISRSLALNPPVQSIKELKQAIALPNEFQSLRRLEELQDLLEWIQSGCILEKLPKDQPKYCALRKADPEAVRAYAAANPLVSKAAIGRLFGISGERVRQILKANKGDKNER